MGSDEWTQWRGTRVWVRGLVHEAVGAVFLDERVLDVVLVVGALGWIHQEAVTGVERGEVVKVAVHFFYVLLVEILEDGYDDAYLLPYVSFCVGSP